MTDRQKRNFLALLCQNGNVTAAAAAIKVSRRTVYDHRAADAAFAEQWDDAVAEACDRLEAEAWRRAVDGVDEPVFGRVGKDKDGQVGIVRKYSDSLMTTLLKAHKPDKYRERSETKHVVTTIDWDRVPADIRDAFIAGEISLDDVRQRHVKPAD